MSAEVELGVWSTRPAFGGSQVAVVGEWVAVAGPGRLSVWRDTQAPNSTPIHSIDAPAPAPGMPRIVDGRVLWGPGMLDLESGEFQLREGAVSPRRPGAVERVQSYAWSADGELLVASLAGGDPPARVLAITEAGVRELWAGSDVAPPAAWVGREAVVVGFRDLRVWDRHGAAIATLPTGTPAVAKIAATKQEDRLLVVAEGRSLTLIDTARWEIVDTWIGRWASAAVDPAGAFVVGLELDGRLRFACLDPAGFGEALASFEAPQRVSVSLGAGRVWVAGAGELAEASYAIRCP